MSNTPEVAETETDETTTTDVAATTTVDPTNVANLVSLVHEGQDSVQSLKI